MRAIIKDEKGLTLIEILVSTVLMVIITVMSYSIFLSISAMGSLTRDEQEAKREIGGWIEQVMATTVSHQDLNTDVANWTDLNAPGSMMRTDYEADWPLNTARPSVSDLNAAYTVDSDVRLNSNTLYRFRRVNLRVQWDEKR